MRDILEQHIRNRDYQSALSVSRRLYDAAQPAAEVVAMHGHVLQHLGRPLESRPVLERASHLLPLLPSVWIDLAHACIEVADWQAAKAAVARFRALAPQSGAGMFADAQVQLGLGDRDRADALFQQAVQQHQNFLNRRLRLAGQAQDQGAFDLADWHYRSCIHQYPKILQTYLDYLASLVKQRLYAQAASIAATALKHWPEEARLLSRYSTLLDLFEAAPEERLEIRLQWLRAAPDSADAHLALANAYATGNDLEAAHRHWQHAQRLAPEQPIARWTAMHFPSQFVFSTNSDADDFKSRWDQELDHFERIPLPEPELCLRLVLCCPSNYLMYAAQDVRSSLERRTALLAKFFDWALQESQAPSPQRIQRQRRRIGVVSPSFGWHSVSRVWRELMLSIDRSAMELICFNVECPEDDSVLEWRRRADHFVDAQGDLLHWHRCLSAADIDVLVFLDLGPDTICQALATRRYAPVQCTTWAFPVTSGSTSIDYFLSSDAMEPEQPLAQSQYCETLIRLPGLACAYRPDARKVPASSSTEVAIAADDRIRYLCAQTASKLLPGHDPLFARVLAENRAATLTISHGGRPIASDALSRRVNAVMSSMHVDTADRLTVLAHLPYEDYLDLLAKTDVILDSMQFSGCLTTLDALSMDIPIVTLPGENMRSRQTAAMLKCLELDELIAKDENDYVRIAVELGHCREWRDSIRQRIGERKHCLYEFSDATRALNDFLRTVQPRSI